MPKQEVKQREETGDKKCSKPPIAHFSLEFESVIF